MKILTILKNKMKMFKIKLGRYSKLEIVAGEKENTVISNLKISSNEYSDDLIKLYVTIVSIEEYIKNKFPKLEKEIDKSKLGLLKITEENY